MKITTRRKPAWERRTEEAAQRRAEREAERTAAGPQRPQPILKHGAYMVPRVWNFAERDDSAYSPEVARERRRKRLRVVYGPEFRLSAEVAAVLGEVAAAMSGDPDPARWTTGVGNAVQCDPADRFADRPAALSDVLESLSKALGQPVPALPEITREAIESGEWVAAVADAVAPLDGPLAADLGRRTGERAGEPIGEWLASELRVLDRVAKRMVAAIGRVNSTNATRPTTESVRVEALRVRHAAERKALAERHTEEMNALGAELKAARTAQRTA